MTIAPFVPLKSVTYRLGARVLGVVGSLVALVFAVLTAIAINDIPHKGFTRGVWILLSLLLARWLLSSVVEEWANGAARRLRAQWRHSLSQHLRLPRREGERGRGDLALAIDHAAQAPSLERLRAGAASSLVGVLVIFWAGGWLPFAITVSLLALAAPLYQRAGKRSESVAAAYQQRRALLEARQLEVLQHAPELRALGAVDYGASEIGALSDREHGIAMQAIRVALESSLVTEFLSGVSIGLVAMVVGFALLGGHISLVRALIAVLVTSELFVQVRRYGVEFHRRDDAQRALIALDASAGNSSRAASDELLLATDLVTEANAAPITLAIRAHNRVLVSGPSGVGKSTLLHTLLGWRQPVHGATARSNAVVGYVGVESSLLSGSLRENLTLGAQVNDDVILERLRSLGLESERFSELGVELLADGRGMSGGERVRLVLARVLLSSPSLIVIDDIAGVLDSEAREKVREALSKLPSTAIIEASVDTPLTLDPTSRIELRP